MLPERTRVLVVGAGLAGLATALFAAAHGTDVLLVDKHPLPCPHPRAISGHPRTRELLATIGVTTREGVGQDQLEAELRALTSVHTSTELVSFHQDADGVTARLLDRWTERLHVVRADYLVAADGWRGTIRRELGIPRPSHVLRSSVGITYHLTSGEETRVLNVDYHPELGESILDFPVDRAIGLIRADLGDPDATPAVRDISAWTAAAGVAARFRDGRVFLVGDAARAIPPERGIGGDAAIADGFDLGWKLAAVHTGQAGPALLDTYQTERRAFAQAAVAGALDPDELLLGLRHRSTAILAEDIDPAPAENPADPTGRPGFRAPKIPLVRNGTELSTTDLFGTGWVLLTGQGGGIWHAAADHAAHVLDIRLTGHGLGPTLTDPTGTLTERYGIGETGASLIRPDGIVAWRSSWEVTNPAVTLVSVLGRLLDRPATVVARRGLTVA